MIAKRGICNRCYTAYENVKCDTDLLPGTWLQCSSPARNLSQSTRDNGRELVASVWEVRGPKAILQRFLFGKNDASKIFAILSYPDEVVLTYCPLPCFSELGAHVLYEHT
jgi:hypothetical protein